MPFPLRMLLLAAGVFLAWIAYKAVALFVREYRRELAQVPLREKRETIMRLFEDGSLCSVGYISNAVNPAGEFRLVLCGPFGVHTRKGMRDELHVDSTSSLLPVRVMDALDGCFDTATSTVSLLSDPEFLQALSMKSSGKIRIASVRSGALHIATQA